jgi:hypothetical protein
MPGSERSWREYEQFPQLADTVIATITILAASLIHIPGADGFKAYDCSNSSNPFKMYLLIDTQPCPDVALNHVVERTLQGEIVQMRWRG